MEAFCKLLQSLKVKITPNIKVVLGRYRWSLRVPPIGGGGFNFHHKGIYRCAAGRGILYRPPSIWMGIIFTSKVYEWGIFFTQKVYEWVKFENLYNEWVHFSIWKYVNGSVFFNFAVYMNWLGSGDSSRTSVPKNMASYHPPPPSWFHHWPSQCWIVNIFMEVLDSGG